MFANCSNSECGVPFDYREGQLIRHCKPPSEGKSSADYHCVEHFWLCGSCSRFYVFENERGSGMKIKLRISELKKKPALSFVSAA
jgi:hypothetical protein